MKKIISVAFMAVLFAVSISITSCNKDVLVIYNVPEKEGCLPSTGIQSSTGYAFTEEILVSDIKSVFNTVNATYDLSRIKTAKFKGFKAVISTTGVNFDQISGLQLYIKADGASGDGEQIAYVDNIGNGVAEVTLNLNGVDIKPLMSNEKLILTLRVFNKAGGNSAVCVKATSGTIEIQAKS